MSMISAQVDKLRELATRWDELQVGAVKAVTMPSDMGSILRDAADTIWQLRDDLQRTITENAKLRELIQDMWTLLVLTGNDDVLVEIDVNGSRELFSADEISDRMRGLGMEADV